MKKELLEIVDKFNDISLLVVGDIMLDKYIIGNCDRISPEAPIPIIDLSETYSTLGGAGNVAQNAKAIGADVLLTGAIGNCHNGNSIAEILALEHIKHNLLYTNKRKTTTKTRIIAGGQQIVRVDNETRRDLTNTYADRIISYVKTKIDKVNAIIISDYGKGVICKRVVDGIRELTKDYDVIISVDPKVSKLSLYKNFTAITPNSKEALILSKKNNITEAGNFFLKKMGMEIALITRGKDGMTLFRKNKGSIDIATLAQSVYDVAGAGDTVIAVFTAALAAGAYTYQAATLANYAAGIAVGKSGTAIVTKEELKERLNA